jgi:sugar O-acyltransferase (sialic acid O-acetyltransferase NeuD family)
LNRKIIVYGGGGHAKVVIDIIERMGIYEIEGIIDDNPHLKGGTLLGYFIIGDKETLPTIFNKGIRDGIVAIGENGSRMRISQLLKDLGFSLITAIHPTAIIGKGVKIASGTVVMANVVVNVDAKVGDGVILNTGCIVEHDVDLGEYVHISPGVRLAGNVRVGRLSHIGIGASVIQGVHIGAAVVVGAGSVVHKDVPQNVTVMGIPARIVKHREVSK